MTSSTSQAPRPAKVKTAAEALLTALAVAGALILVNVLSCGTHARADLTERGIYSLSTASEILVHSLPEKLTIKGYFGNVPAEYADRQTYVENLLAEYADASGGKVTYEKFDVDASDNEKARARQKELAGQGIDKLMLFSFKDDKRQQIPAYFHVKFSYLDKNEVWTAQAGGFTLEGLEYEFSSRIQRVSQVAQKKLGVTTGFGEPEQFQALQAKGVEAGRSGTRVGLGDMYEVAAVDWSKTPADLDKYDVLIVDGPTEKVSDAALYHLDQFLMQGKPVIVLARGMRWQAGGSDQQMPMAGEGEQPYLGQPIDSGLDALLAHYGFVVGKDVILDPRASVAGVIPLGQGEPLETNVLFPLAKVEDGDIGGVLEGLQALVLPYASTVKLTGRLDGTHEGFDVRKLLSTSPASFTKSEMMVLTRQTRIEMPKPGEAHGPYATAYAADGVWPSFFAGKPKPAGVDAPDPGAGNPTKLDTGDKPASGETIAQSPPHTRLIVVGGTGFAEDQTLAIMRFVQNPIYLNGYVAAHAMVDWLVQDTNLVAVRSKRVLRPLDEEKDPGQRMWIKYGNVAGVPLLLVLFGVVFWRVRESRRRRVKI
jgi:gliding-associated putative ABC transporter substrate-binding component GldG